MCMRSSSGRKRRPGTAGCLAVMLIVGGVLAAGCESRPKDGWIGLNTQLGEPMLPMVSPSPDNPPPACLELIRELEMPLVRDVAMNWGLIQPTADGPYDFSSADRIVRAAQDARADLLVVFKGVPGWASARAEPRLVDLQLPARQHADAFAKFVTRFVERYNDDNRSDMSGLKWPVRSYQFMYEMEDIPTAEYAWWLRIFYQSVKAAEPKAVVVLGGLRSPGLELEDQPFGNYPAYFQHLLAEPELAGPSYPYFDVAAFHSFPERYPGRSPFDDAVDYMRQTMASHELGLPIWMTAYGASSGADTLENQAEQLVKWTVKARTLGIQRMYLHCLCDCRDPGHGPVLHCGLLRESTEGEVYRKPAFHAVQKLVREVNDRPDVAFRGDGYYVLSGKGDPRYVVWHEDSYGPGPRLNPGWWSVETMTGPKVVRQGSEVRLTGRPLFVERTKSPFIY
jgi:hypothetical protein